MVDDSTPDITERRKTMNAKHTVGVSALICSLALALTGCNLTSTETTAGSGVAKVRVGNTEICNAAPWIRERAPDGVC